MKDYSENAKKEVLGKKVVDTGYGKMASTVILEQEVAMLEELINQLSERVCYIERNLKY